MKNRNLIFIVILFLFGCEDNPYPKPHGYPRLNLPKVEYQNWSSNCSFTFKKSNGADIENTENDSCFFNLSYTSLNAKVYCSYMPVNGQLKQIIDQEYKLREKHNQFSTSVKEKVFHNTTKDVHALLFQISGTHAATPLQFFITDSVNHFFRGTLYFNTSPNNDSLATAIDFIRNDIDTLVESFEWR
jgi:gliding motility-associated lipoprotein GldD